jgi:hypothetical protein
MNFHEVPGQVAFFCARSQSVGSSEFCMGRTVTSITTPSALTSTANDLLI